MACTARTLNFHLAGKIFILISMTRVTGMAFLVLRGFRTLSLNFETSATFDKVFYVIVYFTQTGPLIL